MVRCTDSNWWIAVAAGLGAALIGCDGGKPTDPTEQPSFLVSPQAPSNTSAAAVAYDAIRVSWRDNSGTESGFQVYRSTTGSTGTFSLRTTRLANATSFRDSPLTPLKSYCYKIRAFRTQDGTTSYSAFSSVACATTPASPIPVAPTGTAARPVSSTAVTTTWTDKSSNEDGFRVQRSTDGRATWTLAGTVGPNITAFRDNGRSTERPVCYRVISFNEHGSSAPSNVDCTAPPAKPTNLAATVTADGGNALTWVDNSTVEDGYQVQRSADGTTFSTIANLAANTRSYSDATAASSTTYWYRVRAKKDGGFSDFSNKANAATRPAAPDGTAAKPASSTGIDVSWLDKSSNETGFRVERSSDAGSTWTTAGTVGANITAFRDEGRAAEQQVCYRVVAFNIAGDSPPSATDCTAPPQSPTALAASAVVDASGINLTWTDNSSVEDGYEVQRTTDGVSFRTLVLLGANTTSYRDDGANNSTLTYWYRVRARKDQGFSDLSNAASAVVACTNSVEVCDNGRDDDCDSGIDLEDSDCSQFYCGFDFCPQGYICGYSGYCVSHCSDGWKNADEGDVDCGYSCRTGCAAGQTCGLHADCASGNCQYGVCQP